MDSADIVKLSSDVEQRLIADFKRIGYTDEERKAKLVELANDVRRVFEECITQERDLMHKLEGTIADIRQRIRDIRDRLERPQDAEVCRSNPLPSLPLSLSPYLIIFVLLTRSPSSLFPLPSFLSSAFYL
jgi:hypothetical protein